MITRAELDEYQSLLSERDELKERLERKRAQVYTIKTQNFSAVPGGHGDVDRIGAAVAQLEELEIYYCEKKMECSRRLNKIEKELKRLDDIEQKILRYRYIDGLWWKEICVKVDYAWAQVHRIHRKSLTKLQHNS